MSSSSKFIVHRRNLYLRRIQPFFGSPVVKIIVGMRRVGKSCLLRLIGQDLIKSGTPAENVLLVDKESLEFDHIRTYQDLGQYASEFFKEKSGPKAMLLDEVQEIDEWEKAVVSFLSIRDMDIFLTGSNAHLFSSELATRLSGRFVQFHIVSLKFSEFLEFRGSDAGTRDEEFKKFIRYGGLPALHQMTMTDEVIFQYLSSIYDTILLKDIVTRHSIRQAALLERIARFIMDNTGQVVSANSIARYFKSQRLKVSVDTVLNYLNYFQEALLTHKALRYDIKGRKLLELHEKYYLGDIGLRHAQLGYREGDISQVLENIVYLELLSRGYTVNVGKLGDKEIDFIAVKDNEKMYIQVTYLLESEQTIKREFAPLLDIRDNYPKLVLSMDSFFGEDYQGVRRMSLMDFLLSSDG